MAEQKISRESFSPYERPELVGWLGSLEGVPGHGAKKVRQLSWQQRKVELFNWLGVILPGAALALGLAVVGQWAAHWLGVDVLKFDKSPISAIMATIVMGLLIRNVIGLPSVYQPGLRVCVKKVLRIGIALLGIRLSLIAAGQIGMISVPIVLACILSALVVVSLFNRWLDVPRRLGSLVAVGTSICGVSAIVATGPVIQADDEEVSYAAACVTLFGMIALFAHVFLGHWVFDGQAQQVGLFLGTAIHDTSQVAGAGLMYQQQFGTPEALDAAVVTKLVRNLCMIWVIPLMAILYQRRHAGGAGERPAWYRMVPLFLAGFLAMIVFRTVGDIGERPFGLLSPAAWDALVGNVKWLAEWCLMLAMAAVGLGTGLGQLRKLGLKPISVGFVAATAVGGVSILMVKLLG